MDTENTSQTVSSSDTSSLSGENLQEDFFTIANGQCSCVDNRSTCIYCSIKEYQEALEKVRNLSKECERRRKEKRRRKLKKKQRRGTNVQQNQKHDANVQQDQHNVESVFLQREENKCSQNYYTSLQLSQTCDRYIQQTLLCDKDIERTESWDTEFQVAENCQTDFQQTQNSDTDTAPSNSSLSEMCHANLVKCDSQFSQIDDTDSYHQSEHRRTDTQKDPHRYTDSEHDENDYTDIEQNQNYCTDFEQVQRCHTKFQQVDKLNVKREAVHMESSSNPPLSGKSKVSKPYCDNLEHSSRESGCKTNHSNDCKMADVKSDTLDAYICTDLPSQDMKRVRRNSKRKRDVEDSCPVCGLTVRCSELSSHFQKEVENLSSISKNIRKPRECNKEKKGVNITFVQVKCNRENRLAAKVAKYTKKKDVLCPICNEKLTGSETQINQHVSNCVGEDYDSDINVVDRDESYEEFEIGNETRIRAISLVPGGYRSLHGLSYKSKPADENDDDLNVDVDDTLTYGKSQYSELDVIHSTSNASEVKELEQLRRAVMSDPAAEPHDIECKKWYQDYDDIKNEISKITGINSEDISKSSTDEDKDTKDEENVQKRESDIISSLKAKIRDLEHQKNVKCLICLEPYTKPTVATTCWHVHCEECWLVSMGVKKLCPQCNTIVCPTNLRRIYL